MKSLLSIPLACAALVACSEPLPNRFPSALEPQTVRLEVDAKALDFGAPLYGETVVRELTLRSTGEAAALVDVSIADDHGFALDAAPRFLAPGESWTLAIAFEASGVGRNTDVIIRSNADRRPVRQVGISVAEALPALVVDPPTLDFGSVSGKDMLRTVHLSNEGVAPLVIEGIEAVGDAFDVVELPELPMTLEPEDSVDVRVRYRPMGPGLVEEGYLQVDANPYRGADVVPLSGASEPLEPEALEEL